MELIFFLLIIHISSSLYCSDNETIKFIADQEYSSKEHLINNNETIFYPQKTNCNSSCCSVPYKSYSCTERGCDALVRLLPAFFCLGIREMVTDCGVWAKSESVSFVQAHAKMWCTSKAWFPCCCDTSKEVCTSTIVNCSTGLTIASIAYGLALFLPCVTQEGCRLLKKKNNHNN